MREPGHLHSRLRICEVVHTASHTKAMSSASTPNPVALVTERIRSAAQLAQRKADSVQLIAVTKTRSAEEIHVVWQDGIKSFGENYLQEALPKIAVLKDLDIIWHFIGKLQGNKTREVAEAFHWVHTIDRERLVDRLGSQTPSDKTLNVLVQVNVDGDTAKGGVAITDEAAMLGILARVQKYPNLRLRGLMTILSETTTPQIGYSQLQAVFERLRTRGGQHWDTLSMGMSADFEAAIACGATLVRVGQALFGPRHTIKENSQT